MQEIGKLTFYHANPSRSGTALWMLEECGADYQLEMLDLQKGEQRSESYLAINPIGKVPCLVHNQTTISELVAICFYLADLFPQANLAPKVGDPRRGKYYQWATFRSNCIEPAVIDQFSPRVEPLDSSRAGWPSVGVIIKCLTDCLTENEYLVGEQFTTADVVTGGGLVWMVDNDVVKATKPIADYVARIKQRPAWQKAAELDS